jgi:hypothetical protein
LKSTPLPPPQPAMTISRTSDPTQRARYEFTTDLQQKVRFFFWAGKGDRLGESLVLPEHAINLPHDTLGHCTVDELRPTAYLSVQNFRSLSQLTLLTAQPSRPSSTP